MNIIKALKKKLDIDKIIYFIYNKKNHYVSSYTKPKTAIKLNNFYINDYSQQKKEIKIILE